MSAIDVVVRRERLTLPSRRLVEITLVSAVLDDRIDVPYPLAALLWLISMQQSTPDKIRRNKVPESVGREEQRWWLPTGYPRKILVSGSWRNPLGYVTGLCVCVVCAE